MNSGHRCCSAASHIRSMWMRDECDGSCSCQRCVSIVANDSVDGVDCELFVFGYFFFWFRLEIMLLPVVIFDFDLVFVFCFGLGDDIEGQNKSTQKYLCNEQT